MNNNISFEGGQIGENAPVFIIAELSANHNQSFDLAVKLIEEAKKAGADAVKIQTYTPDTITLDCDNEHFQITQGTIWDGITLHKLYQSAYTPYEWQPLLKKAADDLGICLFSTPFDFSAVDFLEEMNVPLYKIASFELNDIPLIKYVASKKKPIIMSCGVATISDIELALSACESVGNKDICLLKCSSEYPTPFEDINLRTIPNMKETFDVMCGLSDHSIGHATALGAVALGAKIIEKHITLSRADGGPDSVFSMEIPEFADMVQNIRSLEKALGKVTYELTEKQKKSKEHSRSLFIAEDIKIGEKLTAKNIRSVRPAFGMHTKYYEDVLGKVAKKDLAKGTPLSWDLIE